MKSGDVVNGKYRLTQRIGEGAMGVVWSGEDLATGRPIAIKLISQPTADLRLRFVREVTIGKKLSHRNIVALLDDGETSEGDQFLVMELLLGQTLGDLLKTKRRVEPALAARFAYDIASALCVAHAANVIHRDLKPANIFLHREPGAHDNDEEIIVKVVDFGVAKSLDGGDGLKTVTGAVVGSPAYMSPEQVGMRNDLDPRTDIWSLGIVFYEMLTGQRPFAVSRHDFVGQILTAHIAAVSSKVPGVSAELDAIVAKCLERDRKNRYSSAADLSLALSKLVWQPSPAASRASVIEVEDDNDAAATIQWQGRAGQGDWARRRVNLPPAPPASTTGTLILPPKLTVASPMARDWRTQENMPPESPKPLQTKAIVDDAVHGGTMAIHPAAGDLAVVGGMGAGTTSTGGLVSSVRPARKGSSPVLNREPRGNGRRLLMAEVVMGSLVALGFVALLVVKLSGLPAFHQTTAQVGLSVSCRVLAGVCLPLPSPAGAQEFVYPPMKQTPTKKKAYFTPRKVVAVEDPAHRGSGRVFGWK